MIKNGKILWFVFLIGLAIDFIFNPQNHTVKHILLINLAGTGLVALVWIMISPIFQRAEK